MKTNTQSENEVKGHKKGGHSVTSQKGGHSERDRSKRGGGVHKTQQIKNVSIILGEDCDQPACPS